jgi:hypothetical protein
MVDLMPYESLYGASLSLQVVRGRPKTAEALSDFPA